MDILLGLFMVIFGISIAFFGIQVFFAILPLLGLITGFFAGAIGVEAIFGDGFLSTVTGWIVGIGVGLLFAGIAWYWWYAGVLLAAGSTGSLLATTIAEAIGVSSGIVLFIFAAIGAALVIIITYMLNLPVYMVIVNTAIAGASVFLTGIMLVFNQVDYQELEEGLGVATAEASWFWVIAWAVVAAVGISRQLALKQYIRLPIERWAPATS